MRLFSTGTAGTYVITFHTKGAGARGSVVIGVAAADLIQAVGVWGALCSPAQK